MAKVHILRQLSKLLRNYKLSDREACSGDLYGLQNETSEDLFVLCCCIDSHQLQHDPTLLLPSSFVKLGTFVICSSTPKHISLQKNEIALIYLKPDEEIEIYTKSEDAERRRENYDIIEESALYEHFVIARTRYSYEFLSRDKTADVKSSINKFKEEVLSGMSYFKMKTFMVQNKLNSEIIYTKEAHDRTLSDIGSLFKNSKKKNSPSSFNFLSFDLLFNKSTGLSNAPVAQVESSKFKIIRMSFSGDVVIYIPKSMLLTTLANHLAKGIAHQVQLLEYWLVKQLQDRKNLGSLKSYTIKHFLIGYIVSPIYPSLTEDALKEYRKQVHITFLYPTDRPLLRKLNKFAFPGERLTPVLVNPHEAVQNPNFGDCQVGIVQGNYGYHHYMQDRIDDNKWGCAYRSLQTVISWFRMQGYTDEPIPSHKKIQEVLVDIRDKPSSFIGSKQWIGSTEVGFFLENYIRVSSKFISVSSGAEIASKGRELVYHFNTTGTPIMIGGGVLAHTILGASFNPTSGDTKFLILDPHYTGGENITQILKQGWCGWKGPEFWDKKAFYNLCLPQRPILI